MKTVIKLLISAVLLAVLGACSGNGGTETGTTNSPQISASLKLATETNAPMGMARKAVGQAPAAGLLSMKYYITSITICNSMDTTGTAYSNPDGCLELYAGNQEDSNYTYELGDDYAPFGDVARLSNTGFVDLIDDTSRATLNSSRTLTSDDVREYNYGYINWYLPVKLTAEVDMGDGSFFRTDDGTTVTNDADQGPITTAITDFTAVETASEAVVVLNNGGSWFKFQNPFEITQADIDAGTQFALDLTFNPEGLIKAYTADVGSCGNCALVDPTGNQFLVPMLDLTPVPHKTSETVQKETYVASISTGEANNFDLRIELYSIQDDPEATIYGIDANTLINAETTAAASSFPKVSFIETGDDGNLVLEDYRGSDGQLVTSFQRLTEEGATASAVIHCGDPSTGGFITDGCADGETLDVTFTLESISTLD